MEIFTSKKGVFGVNEQGEFCPYVGHQYKESDDGRVPISSRLKITLHNGQEFQLGDIVQRVGVGLDMVVTGPNSLDFGSGYCGIVMVRTGRYVKVGSIYEDITPLCAYLASRNEKIDFEFYGMEPF